MGKGGLYFLWGPEGKSVLLLFFFHFLEIITINYYQAYCTFLMMTALYFAFVGTSPFLSLTLL